MRKREKSKSQTEKEGKQQQTEDNNNNNKNENENKTRLQERPQRKKSTRRLDEKKAQKKEISFTTLSVKPSTNLRTIPLLTVVFILLER